MLRPEPTVGIAVVTISAIETDSCWDSYISLVDGLYPPIFTILHH